MAEVPASLRLRGIQRGVQSHRCERVLKRRARERVRVHVTGRHALDTEALREPGQAPVTGVVALEEGSLQLDSQPVDTERFQQSLQGGLVVHSAQRAPTQANEAISVVQDGFERDVRLRGRARLLARVCVRARQDATEIGPPPRVLDQQRQTEL